MNQRRLIYKNRSGDTKLALQTVLGALSLVPLFFGLLGLAGGVGRYLEPADITPALDSQFRFLSAWYLGLAALIWRAIPTIEREGGLMAVIVAAIFLGGLARVYSIMQVGPPPGIIYAALALELSSPLLLLWQSTLPRRSNKLS